MLNVDLSKDVQLLDDGLLLVAFSENLYEPNFGSIKTGQMNEALHGACGAMASPFIRKFVKEIAPDDYVIMSGFLAGFNIDITEVKGTMWYHRDLYSKVSEESKMCIVGHEVAHLRLGHLEDIIEEAGGIQALIDNFRSTGQIPIMDSPRRELEADAYSATLLGKKAMQMALREISGIKEVHEYVRRLYPHMSISNGDVQERLLEKLKYRLDALA